MDLRKVYVLKIAELNSDETVKTLRYFTNLVRTPKAATYTTSSMPMYQADLIFSESIENAMRFDDFKKAVEVSKLLYRYNHFQFVETVEMREDVSTRTLYDVEQVFIGEDLVKLFTDKL